MFGLYRIWILAAIVAALTLGSLTRPTVADAAGRDYRSRTIYFLVADRFHASQPWRPYVDPEHPFATNTRDCFVESCPLEEEWRRYWGGNVPGIVEKLDYLKRLGASAIWITPLMENVPVCAQPGLQGLGHRLPRLLGRELLPR